MVLPERWQVAEHTFRPPGFHRNSVAEFLSIVSGNHNSKSSSFAPGGASLHNNWAPHGPDVSTLERGRAAPLEPQKIDNSLVFMIESRFPLSVTTAALAAPEREVDYSDIWKGFKKRFNKTSH
jgi:homogentisate 1,2-dioxygenase